MAPRPEADGAHWMLITGTDGDNYIVNDPFSITKKPGDVYSIDSTLDRMQWNYQERLSRQQEQVVVFACTKNSGLKFEEIKFPTIQVGTFVTYSLRTQAAGEAISYSISSGQLPPGLVITNVGQISRVRALG